MDRVQLTKHQKIMIAKILKNYIIKKSLLNHCCFFWASGRIWKWHRDLNEDILWLALFFRLQLAMLICAQWRYSYFVTAFLDLVDGIFFDFSIYRRYKAVTVFFGSDGIKILSSLYPAEKNTVNWRYFQKEKKILSGDVTVFF